jgi:hypothetical protein
MKDATRTFEVGQAVHVNHDSKDWGRIASDGTVLEVTRRQVLVNVQSIRADIFVPKSAVSMRTL